MKTTRTALHRRMGTPARPRLDWSPGHLWILLLVISFSACKSSTNSNGLTSETGDKPVVAVTNYPLKFFTEQIAGDRVEILFLVEPDADPRRWRPDGSAITMLQKADRIFLNGAGYESWLSGVTLSQAKLIDTTASAKDQLIELDSTQVHQHGPGGEHSHHETAATTWLDMEIAVLQARAIRDELLGMLPDEKGALNENFNKLESQLLEIKRRLDGVASELNGHLVVGARPVYHYLLRTLELEPQSIDFAAGQEPTNEQWKALEEIVGTRPSPIPIMLWESQPEEPLCTEIRKRGVTILEFPTLDNQPASGDFLSRMVENIQRLKVGILMLRQR